jgi:hypothetical protein
MVRRPDQPLRVVRVSFEATRFSAQHLIDAYSALVPTVRRTRLRSLPEKSELPPAPAMTTKRRRGEA